MKIEFNDNLVTGNETIDAQHMELINRIDQFVKICESGDGKVKAIKMLDYLSEYTDFHFSAEEKLQQDVNYPGYSKHKEKHEEFKKTIEVLHNYLDELDGPNDAFVKQVQDKVVDWLFGHIETFDRSVAEYIFLTENPNRL